jgi:hypothetical protein
MRCILLFFNGFVQKLKFSNNSINKEPSELQGECHEMPDKGLSYAKEPRGS